MNKNIILNIQKEFIENANTKYSLNYLNDYILPIIEYIVFSNKKKFLIGGSQGIGKSTLVKIIKKIIQTFYNKKVLILCLDDYYLTKKEREFLAKNVHPLLINRGVPGTHDIVKLLRDIKKFEDNNYPIKIPIFDKLIDDRLRKKRVEILKSDILILEGWCCGAEHVKNNYLFKNINQLEKNKDVNFIWRKFYNNKLKNEYQNLFKIFEKKIYFKAPSFNYILNWRYKQEKFNHSNSKFKNKMSKKNIDLFVQNYEKITKWMFKTSTKKSHILIKVNNKQKISSVKYKKN